MMVRMVSICGVPTNAIYHPSMLSLKWRNPGEWSIVSNLMCDKMNKPVWAIIQGVYQKVGHGGDDDGELVMVTGQGDGDGQADGLGDRHHH